MRLMTKPDKKKRMPNGSMTAAAAIAMLRPPKHTTAREKERMRFWGGPGLWQSPVEQGGEAATGSDDEVNEGICFSLSPLSFQFFVSLFWWCFGGLVKLYQWFCEGNWILFFFLRKINSKKYFWKLINFLKEKIGRKFNGTLIELLNWTKTKDKWLNWMLKFRVLNWTLTKIKWYNLWFGLKKIIYYMYGFKIWVWMI